MWQIDFPYLKIQMCFMWIPSCKIETLYENELILDSGWGEKVARRRSTGTGRMRYLKSIARRAKNGFRAGT
jgi:hypothetical protein